MRLECSHRQLLQKFGSYHRQLESSTLYEQANQISKPKLADSIDCHDIPFDDASVKAYPS